MSAGSGASKRIAAPVTGWTKPRLAACSAWRGKPPSRPGAARAGRRRVSPTSGWPAKAHVHADLVGAPGLQPALDQRARRAVGPKRSSTRARVTAGLPPSLSTAMRLRSPGCRPMLPSIRSTPPGSQVMPARCREPRLGRVGRAVHHREVAPLEVVRRELRREAAGGRRRSWRPPAARRCPCRCGARCRAGAARRSPRACRRSGAGARSPACRRARPARDAPRGPAGLSMTMRSASS